MQSVWKYLTISYRQIYAQKVKRIIFMAKSAEGKVTQRGLPS
jgi:hypothetical protein